MHLGTLPLGSLQEINQDLSNNVAPISAGDTATVGGIVYTAVMVGNTLQFTIPGAGGGSGGAVASVNGKTGAVTLVKADIGLGNVDNVSMATERAATATLTNKTISGANNTLSNIPQSAVTGLSTALTTIPQSSVTGLVAALAAVAPPTVQASRSGASTLANSDKNTLIPFSAAGNVTIPTGLTADALFSAELRSTGAFAMAVTRGSGMVMIDKATGQDVASLSSSANGASIFIEGTTVTNQFNVFKVGV